MTAMPLQADRIVTTLSIDQIRVDGGTQPRDHINLDAVERYKTLVKDGREFPPITVFFDGTHYWLADGFHRITAWGSLGWEEVPAEVVSGSLREAQWHSFSVNALHGLPRRDADIAKILGRIFADEEWRGLPVREISGHTGISKSTVFEYRDRNVFGAQKRSHSSTVSAGGQSKPATEEAQPKVKATEPEPLPEPDEPEWRQTDIEEFIPRFPSAHMAPAENIRRRVEGLHEALTLTPEQVAATVTVNVHDYRYQLANVEAWLGELLDHLQGKDSEQ